MSGLPPDTCTGGLRCACPPLWMPVASVLLRRLAFRRLERHDLAASETPRYVPSVRSLIRDMLIHTARPHTPTRPNEATSVVRLNRVFGDSKSMLINIGGDTLALDGEIRRHIENEVAKLAARFPGEDLEARATIQEEFDPLHGHRVRCALRQNRPRAPNRRPGRTPDSEGSHRRGLRACAPQPAAGAPPSQYPPQPPARRLEYRNARDRRMIPEGGTESCRFDKQVRFRSVSFPHRLPSVRISWFLRCPTRHRRGSLARSSCERPPAATGRHPRHLRPPRSFARDAVRRQRCAWTRCR